MLISNRTILADINRFGIDKVVETIDPELISDLTIKIIFRTIKESKEALITTLHERALEDLQKETSGPLAG